MPFWPFEDFGNLLKGSPNCCLSKRDIGSVHTSLKCYAFYYPYCFQPKRTDCTKHAQPVEPNCIQKAPEVTPEAPSCFLPVCWCCIKLRKGISAQVKEWREIRKGKKHFCPQCNMAVWQNPKNLWPALTVALLPSHMWPICEQRRSCVQSRPTGWGHYREVCLFHQLW